MKHQEKKILGGEKKKKNDSTNELWDNIKQFISKCNKFQKEIGRQKDYFKK